MAIIINIDVMLAKRKMSVTELSEKVGITMANISVLKTARQKQSDYQHWKRFAKRWNVSLEIFWSITKYDFHKKNPPIRPEFRLPRTDRLLGQLPLESASAL